MWHYYVNTLKNLWEGILIHSKPKLRQSKNWLVGEPVNARGDRFGLTHLEVSLVLILFLVQVAIALTGIQANFWWAVLCWIAIALLTIRIIWKWEVIAHFNNLKKILASVIVVGTIVVLVHAQLTKTFYLTVRPSFILLMPGQDLVDCERRAFVVTHKGARALQNAEIALLDRDAKQGNVTQYAEIPPGAPDPANPKYIWWNPANPWREDYTFTITSGDEKITQRLIVTSARGKLQRATEVSVGGKLVFECRDFNMPSSYTLASDSPEVCSSLDIPEEITRKMVSSAFNIQRPDGSLVMQQLRKLSPKPGVEGQSETRHIWEYQRIHMIRGLSKYSGTRISLLASSSGDDTWRFAEELGDVLRQAKWDVAGPRKLPPSYDGLLDVQLSSDNVTIERAERTALLEVLTGVGIKHRSRYVLDAEVPRDTILLWVGSRSPEDVTSDDCPGVTLQPPRDEASKPCGMVAQEKHFCPFPP